MEISKDPIAVEELEQGVVKPRAPDAETPANGNEREHQQSSYERQASVQL